MPDILFIKTSSLGDVIHHMPALTDASRHRPDARFAWVVEEAYVPLARLHPAAGDVIAVAARRWLGSVFQPSSWHEARDFVRRLRTRAYDDIVDTQGLIKSAIIARAARGRRHGYDSSSIREPAASAAYDVRHSVSRDLHAIDRNRLLTGLALGYQPSGPIDYGLERDASAVSGGDRYSVFLHATARAEKEWPEENWIALCRALPDAGRIVLPWGNERERVCSERIAAALPRAIVPPRQPLDEIARLIGGASLVVGVDTGLLHLAAALHVPLVAIFTGSEPGLTGPKGAGPIAVLGGKHRMPATTDVIDAVAQVRAVKSD
jgi:heptosyltransferase-1